MRACSRNSVSSAPRSPGDGLAVLGDAETRSHRDPTLLAIADVDHATPKDAASKMPLELLPTTTSAAASTGR